MTLLVFLILAIGVMLVDVYTREPGIESLKRSTTWSAIYIASSLVFATYLFVAEGSARATLFLSAYTIEKAMSMDNLIIFGAIFSYFGVRAEHEYRVLHWGIIGSAVLRFVFIAAGLAMTFVFGRILDLAFGAFVIWTAIKMMQSSEPQQIDHNGRWYIRWTIRIFPVSTEMTGRFFIKHRFRLLPAVTPLFFCLLAVEFTDIAFAFDSVPAVIGLTRDTMLAYSSVMFAVLGLRSLYFVLEALKRYTESLSHAVMVILCFVGGKMLVHGLTGYDISAQVTLGFIVGCLLVGIGLSVWNNSSLEHP